MRGGVRKAGFDLKTGLLVDGKLPSHSCYEEADDFHPLQSGSTLFH